MEEAFQRVKGALTSAPVLRAPDFSCPFLLQTDASNTGLGAVLSQIQEGEEHPVIYISRKLTPAERNYAAVEKEALAIKWAVLDLRYYLLGRKFTLVTDHAPLQWMARAKDTNARVTRWFLALQDFHFVVRHRAGAANANADGLSRIWAAFTGLSGVTPHPPPIFPLLSHVTNRTRMSHGGGGSVTSVPKLHQRRPGNKQGTPAHPHHRLIGHSCSSSHGGYISHASPTTSETLLHETEHLLALSFLSQIAACDQPAPQEHPTDSLHWKEGGEHSAHRSTHVDFSLVALPSFVINPPSGAIYIYKPRDYIYIYIYIVTWEPEKMLILQENCRWHLKAFASELFIYIYMKSSDAKAFKCHLQFSCKISIFSGSHVYVHFFHFNDNENNLFIAIKVNKAIQAHWKIMPRSTFFQRKTLFSATHWTFHFETCNIQFLQKHLQTWVATKRTDFHPFLVTELYRYFKYVFRLVTLKLCYTSGYV